MSRFVTFGEIMGRLAAPGFQRFQQAMPGSLHATFAGAEASIAASLAYLGCEAAFVTALPEHAIADACLANLASLGIDTRQIVRTERGRLGLFFLESGANQRPSHVIYDREGSAVAVTPASAYDWTAIFADTTWFAISGITPAISRNAADVTRVALQQARRRGVKIAFDVNYRSKLWRWHDALKPRQLATQTLQELIPFANLLVIGREDMEEVLDNHDDLPLEELARRLAGEYPALEQIALTLRQNVSATQNDFGGLLYDRGTDHVYRAPETGTLYSITHIVERLGTGDAFTAGLLFALNTSELAAPQAAISFATAAACLAHSIEGDVNLSTRSEIESLAAGQASGRVSR